MSHISIGRPDHVMRNVFAGMDGYMLCYDITSRSSLNELYEWREFITDSLECGTEDLPAVLVGIKVSVDSVSTFTRSEYLLFNMFSARARVRTPCPQEGRGSPCPGMGNPVLRGVSKEQYAYQSKQPFSCPAPLSIRNQCTS